MPLKTSGNLNKVIRMGPETFKQLCELLQTNGGLQPTQKATIEEQVVKFLHILSLPATNGAVSYFYRHSGETISRHFHRVLRAVITLEDQFLRQPTGEQIPPEILDSDRFSPYFKDWVGAIDGTHVRVKVSSNEAARYRGRKEHPTKNALAAYSFDLKFTYVLPGWEGPTSDSRIIKNAMNREDKLIIPNDKYYLVDAGFMLKRGLLTPYRNIRSGERTSETEGELGDDGAGDSEADEKRPVPLPFSLEEHRPRIEFLHFSLLIDSPMGDRVRWGGMIMSDYEKGLHCGFELGWASNGFSLRSS
ncbi:hypothetical protein ACH5RR_019220 [Cinchona calisaya]|uniref:Transposase n=1 Tax=Cinchona calisaya TaxID=153742 RepID=A0ABD2ZNU2_9GENT